MRDTMADFHEHNSGAECFFVVSGVLHLDTDYGTVDLAPGQFFEVPAGVRHRARVGGEARLIVVDAF